MKKMFLATLLVMLLIVTMIPVMIPHAPALSTSFAYGSNDFETDGQFSNTQNDHYNQDYLWAPAGTVTLSVVDGAGVDGSKALLNSQRGGQYDRGVVRFGHGATATGRYEVSFSIKSVDSASMAMNPAIEIISYDAANNSYKSDYVQLSAWEVIGTEAYINKSYTISVVRGGGSTVIKMPASADYTVPEGYQLLKYGLYINFNETSDFYIDNFSFRQLSRVNDFETDGQFSNTQNDHYNQDYLWAPAGTVTLSVVDGAGVDGSKALLNSQRGGQYDRGVVRFGTDMNQPALYNISFSIKSADSTSVSMNPYMEIITYNSTTDHYKQDFAELSSWESIGHTVSEGYMRKSYNFEVMQDGGGVKIKLPSGTDFTVPEGYVIKCYGLTLNFDETADFYLDNVSFGYADPNESQMTPEERMTKEFAYAKDIVYDGQMEEAWNAAGWINIDGLQSGIVDPIGRFKALWDEDGLSVFLEVAQDDELGTIAEGEIWAHDGMTCYLRERECESDKQVGSVTGDKTSYLDIFNQCGAFVLDDRAVVVDNNTNSYVMEFRIPFHYKNKANGSVIRMALIIADWEDTDTGGVGRGNAEAGGRVGFRGWSATNVAEWSSSLQWGYITLTGRPDDGGVVDGEEPELPPKQPIPTTEENPKVNTPEDGDIMSEAVYLSWNAVQGATLYQIDVYKVITSGDTETYEFVKTLQSAVTSFTVTGLEEGTDYAFQVVAYAGSTSPAEVFELLKLKTLGGDETPEQPETPEPPDTFDVLLYLLPGMVISAASALLLIRRHRLY